MDKTTLEASFELVSGVMADTHLYLFQGLKRDKVDMVEEILDAISEMESWIKAIKEKKE